MRIGMGSAAYARSCADNYAITAGVDIRVRVRGGGHTSQVYAIRQAIAKSIVRPPVNSFRHGFTA